MKIEISYSEEENKGLQRAISLLGPMIHHVKKCDKTNGKYRKAWIYLHEKVLQ